MILLRTISYHVFSGDGGGYNDTGALTLPAGLPLYLKTSHITSLFLPIRKGSLYSATGWRYMSELEPSAWYVLEPS